MLEEHVEHYHPFVKIEGPLFDKILEKNDIDASVSYRRTFRSAFSQILATCAKNLLLLTYGMTLGITTIAIPALDGDSNKRDMTEAQRNHRTDVITLTGSEISWFSSIHLVCVPLGCFISGAVTQPLGRKKSLIMLNIPYFLVWVLYYNASNVTTLYIASLLSGLAGGLHEAPTLTYVVEITEPHLRGMLGSTAPTTVILGTVSQFILGKFFHWRRVLLFNMVVPIVTFLALCFVPESPHWLLNRGRYEDAEKSLCWLRGWVTPDQVRRELGTLKKFIRTKHASNRVSFTETIRSYTHRTFVIPHFIVITSFFVGHFGGMMSMQIHAVKLFSVLGTPINEYTSTLFLGVSQFAGAVVCVVMVHWSGKRKLLISTTAGCGGCLFILAAFDYFRAESSSFISSWTWFGWIPIIFLNVNAFLLHAGIRLIPWVLIAEVYPTNIRATASGASALWFYIFAFLANRSFYWMLETLHLFGLLAMYGTVILFGSIFFFTFLPETEGLTLYEIERHFACKGHVFETKIRPRACEINEMIQPSPVDDLRLSTTTDDRVITSDRLH